MVFFAALAPRRSSSSASPSARRRAMRAARPGLKVLLVSDELPEAAENDTATYLAQRTQLGSGNTPEAVAPRNRAAALPVLSRPALPGRSLEAAATEGRRYRSACSRRPAGVRGALFRGRLGTTGSQRSSRCSSTSGAGGAGGAGRRSRGPRNSTGPKRDELWVTPDTRAATLAPYLDAWRHKVERIGTLNYPSRRALRPRATQVRSSRWDQRQRYPRQGRHPPLERRSRARSGGARRS